MKNTIDRIDPEKYAGHTPGDWINDGSCRVQSKSYDVCRMCSPPFHIPENERRDTALMNACLIADAPRLLRTTLALQAECDRMREALEEIIGSDHCHTSVIGIASAGLNGTRGTP